MICFEFLKKGEFNKLSRTIFDILSGNMSVIAPTGNSIEDDYIMWNNALTESLGNDNRQIILVMDNESVVGYFQYLINDNTFMMEEIQFMPEYQGRGIFRKLYCYVLDNIRYDLKYVEAYANIYNQKSMDILEWLGLSAIGLNKNGRSYHYKGSFKEFLKVFNRG